MLQTIYNYLNDEVLPALQTKHGEALLVELVKRGKNHMLIVKWLKLFFAYLDRYHVKYYSLPTLGESGLLKFKELIFDKCGLWNPTASGKWPAPSFKATP